jgi:hypothetical protein
MVGSASAFAMIMRGDGRVSSLIAGGVTSLQLDL